MGTEQSLQTKKSVDKKDKKSVDKKDKKSVDKKIVKKDKKIVKKTVLKKHIGGKVPYEPEYDISRSTKVIANDLNESHKGNIIRIPSKYKSGIFNSVKKYNTYIRIYFDRGLANVFQPYIDVDLKDDVECFIENIKGYEPKSITLKAGELDKSHVGRIIEISGKKSGIVYDIHKDIHKDSTKYITIFFDLKFSNLLLRPRIIVNANEECTIKDNLKRIDAIIANEKFLEIESSKLNTVKHQGFRLKCPFNEIYGIIDSVEEITSKKLNKNLIKINFYGGRSIKYLPIDTICYLCGDRLMSVVKELNPYNLSGIKL